MPTEQRETRDYAPDVISDASNLAGELEERLRAAHERSAHLRHELEDSDTVCAGLEAALSTIREREQMLQAPQPQPVGRY